MNSPTSLVANTAEEKHTPTPWFAFNMVHEKHGRPLTPQELGEYVTNNILKSIADGGSTDRFLFICQAGEGVPDICHVGNGPAGPANAAFIVKACNSFDALTEANKKLVAALENAIHRLRWLRQFTTIEPAPVDAELVEWADLVKAAKVTP